MKVFGCRPSQVAGVGVGRRTETAQARTRGGHARRYGDLKIVARRRRWRGGCDLTLSGDDEQRRRSVSAQVERAHSGRRVDLAAIGAVLRLAVELDM